MRTSLFVRLPKMTAEIDLVLVDEPDAFGLQQFRITAGCPQFKPPVSSPFRLTTAWATSEMSGGA